MANLTNQQIKDTYYGLLNLQTSTTGITTNYQNIEDGLGNNTGLQIKQDAFYSNNFSADTYNGIFEYPGRWTPPTFSATSQADYGNSGSTGFMLINTTTVGATTLSGLTTASDSNVYGIPFWLYKGEIFRGISYWVRTSSSSNIRTAIYGSVAKSGTWSTGIQALAVGQKVFDIGVQSVSVTGLTYQSFPYEWEVPYTGLWWVMMQCEQSSTLQLAGNPTGTIALTTNRFSTQANIGVWRVDTSPTFTVSMVQPYTSQYWTNRTFSNGLPTTFDYTVNSANWNAQGITIGLHYVNQLQ